ncbi:MAG: hypothetical protein ACKESB_00495 [Candidatus Hodgkinia cicadicola]
MYAELELGKQDGRKLSVGVSKDEKLYEVVLFGGFKRSKNQCNKRG